jgi:hypothetical protein
MIKPKKRQRWLCSLGPDSFICEVLTVHLDGYVKLKVVHVIKGSIVKKDQILHNELFHEATDKYLEGQDAPK